MASKVDEYAGYEIYLETIKINKFKQLVEALKEIVLDVNLDFSPEGLKMKSINVTETVLVKLTITSDIGDYYCKKTRSLGINMGRFHQIIKSLNNQDVLSIFVEEGEEERNMLIINIENKAKGISNRYEMNIFDPIKQINGMIPEIEYGCVFKMPSSDFQRICRNMESFAKLLEITSSDNVLYLTGKGDITSLQTTIRPTVNNQDTDESMNYLVNSNPSEIIQGFFNLKELILFNKCANINKTVKLRLQNDEAFMINYKVGDFGDLELCVVPTLGDD
jgi:proliferating cell nuclear antigen